MDRIVLSLLGGITLGSVLFMVSAGLTLTFGVGRVLNLAHGALYMVGAYVGWSVAVDLGIGYGWAVLAGGVAAAVIGLVIDRGLLRWLPGGINEQAVLTYGLLLIITNVTQWVWGPEPKPPYGPEGLSGSISLAGASFPTARVALMAAAALLALALWAMDRGTLVGARIRAGRADREMLEMLGVNFRLLTMGLFAFGAFVAGIGGVLGAMVLGANLSLAIDVLLLALVVVVVGGLGSVPGALLGAMIIGCVQSFGTGYFPELSSFTVYLIMILILLIRPTGLVKSAG